MGKWWRIWHWFSYPKKWVLHNLWQCWRWALHTHTHRITHEQPSPSRCQWQTDMSPFFYYRLSSPAHLPRHSPAHSQFRLNGIFNLFRYACKEYKSCKRLLACFSYAIKSGVALHGLRAWSISSYCYLWKMSMPTAQWILTGWVRVTDCPSRRQQTSTTCVSCVI